MDTIVSYNLDKFDEDIQLLVKKQILDLKAKLDSDVLEVLKKASEYQEKRKLNTEEETQNIIPSSAIQEDSCSQRNDLCVRRSCRSKSRPNPYTSPVLRIKVRKRRRKFFPKITDEILRKLTDEKFSSFFTLPKSYDSYILIKKSISVIKKPLKLDMANILYTTASKIYKHEEKISCNKNLKVESNENIDGTVNSEEPTNKHSKKSQPPNKTTVNHISLKKFTEGSILLAVATANEKIILYIKEKITGLWKEIASWTRQVENMMWMMSSDENPLLLQCSALLWVSKVQVNSGGSIAHFQTSISFSICAAVLPSLCVVVGNTQPEKYVWKNSTRDFTLERVMQTAEQPIVSLGNLNNEPRVLVGCTATIFCIWNHLTGSLLKKICIGDKEITKRIISATTLQEGVLKMTLLMENESGLVCSDIACNPISGKLVVINKRKSRKIVKSYLYLREDRFPMFEATTQSLISQL
uniref:Uncharacterized LOC100186428 n=1 Tax=Ciona intestinalis TaxID=7719 RepID=F6XCM4_CIOIN|nr:uncharacterized protein LOC100186428 isoform X1 [Ciona intestinalis]|eukprot:XP_002131763.1 uncharacterized protein LOC100186428 isoform X1 [Ciona intestinalis]